MKRNLLSILLTALFLLFGQPLFAYDFEVDGIYYNITSSTDLTVEVTWGTSSSNSYSGDVVIPATVYNDGKTYSVTSIGGFAFSYCYGLTSIEIPSSVTSISDQAFYGCLSLTSIEIPSSVTSISDHAFGWCNGLTSIVVDAGNSVYDSRNNCNAIIETETNTLIGGCQNTVIPSSVTSIGRDAFSSCTGLTSIEIPSSVTSIGNGAFWGCTGLTSIVVDAGNSVYDSRNNCNAIIETETNTLIAGCQNTVIPNSVTSIGNQAFYGCDGLTSIEIPSSVTSIGNQAFYGCVGLTSIEIPSSVTSICDQAFGWCYGLTSIVVDAGNSVYDSRNNCNAIIETETNTLIGGCQNTVIPSSVTSIGRDAFLACSGLTSIEIPSKVTSIGSSAFANCWGLTSIEIPSSVTSIGSYAFASTAWYDNQPDGLVYAGKVAYKYKGTMPDNTNIALTDGTLGIASEAFRACSGLTSIEIPSSVTSIGSYAFSGCTGLTSIEIPSSVISIGYYAFDGCTGLTSIEIPSSVTSIGYNAFGGCTGLTSIEISSGVTSIGEYAFNGCVNLKSVTVLNPTPVHIDSYTFYNCTNATLYVPKGSKAAYEAAPYWNEFKEIVEIEVGTEDLYDITVPEFALGSVSSDKARAAAGDIVTFTAVPNAGHYLKELKVQKCTSADEAEAAPQRPVDVASAESVTMTYDAATGSYSGKYTMPACDVAVVLADFAAKTSQSLVTNDVTATLGETALAVTATNGTQGGGTLTYAVSEGSDAVSIDAETGALTVLKAGKATVTVTAAETERYQATTVSVKVTILGTIIAQANNVNVTYDGTAHGIAVKVSEPSAGYTIVYGTEAGQCTSATSPTQTTAGTLTVYYEVSADNYALLAGSATVTVAKADIATGGYTAPETVVVTGDGIAYSGGEQALVSGGVSADGTVHYRVNGGEWSEETPSATEPGTYIIDWYVEGDANHNDVGSETEPAGSLAVTILAQREVTMANGVATFYDGASAYNIPDNVRAWTGTVDYANGCVNMSEVTGGVIPAGTAVVLTSDETAITLVQSLSAASAIESDLKGTDTYAGGALTGVENIYVMRGGEFVWANSGTLPSGKAYLVYDASQAQAAATRLRLNFGGEELGIAAIESLAEKQSLYNLQGQKIGQPRKGEIYVKGGRKAVIR